MLRQITGFMQRLVENILPDRLAPQCSSPRRNQSMAADFSGRCCVHWRDDDAAPIFNIRQIPVRFRMLLAVLITSSCSWPLPTSPVVYVFSNDALLIALQQIGDRGCARFPDADGVQRPDLRRPGDGL